MCTEIDERTRENPEAAMVHTELLDVQLREMKKDEAYRSLYATINQQAAFNRPYPVSWEQALGCISPGEKVEINPIATWLDEDGSLRCMEDASKPEAQHFDTEAHRAFMRGLG